MMATSLPALPPVAHDAPARPQDSGTPTNQDQHEKSQLHLAAEFDPLWPLVVLIGEIARRVSSQTDSQLTNGTDVA